MWCNQWHSQGLPSGEPKWRQKWGKFEEKWEKIMDIWGKWNACPPGTARLATPPGYAPGCNQTKWVPSCTKLMHGIGVIPSELLDTMFLVICKEYIHLAQLIPRYFLKPAMCKYSITVIKSEIYILLPKPYSLMWCLVHRNHVRNGHDRRPETRRMRSPKVALLKISMDSVQYNTEHCGINDDTDDKHSV